jgi:hypothetical protein
MRLYRHGRLAVHAGNDDIRKCLSLRTMFEIMAAFPYSKIN